MRMTNTLPVYLAWDPDKDQDGEGASEYAALSMRDAAERCASDNWSGIDPWDEKTFRVKSHSGGEARDFVVTCECVPEFWAKEKK